MDKTKTCLAAIALGFSQLAFAGGDAYPTAECFDRLAGDTRLKHLDGKVAAGRDDDVARASLKRVATPDERATLGLWSRLRQECHALGAAHRVAAHPGFPALADVQFARQQALIGELRDGRVGYAEFNARRLELWEIAHRHQAELLRSDKSHNAALSLR